LGVARSRLSAAGRPGYVRRWINDKEGRLQLAQEVDYQFVTDYKMQVGDVDISNGNSDLGSRVSRVVDQTTGQRAYLMEIREELYQEDQAAKASALDETDRRIRTGKCATDDNRDGRYIPDNGRGIDIQRSK
jgi:hypothetical protein